MASCWWLHDLNEVYQHVLYQRLKKKCVPHTREHFMVVLLIQVCMMQCSLSLPGGNLGQKHLICIHSLTGEERLRVLECSMLPILQHQVNLRQWKLAYNCWICRTLTTVIARATVVEGIPETPAWDRWCCRRWQQCDLNIEWSKEQWEQPEWWKWNTFEGERI